MHAGRCGGGREGCLTQATKPRPGPVKCCPWEGERFPGGRWRARILATAEVPLRVARVDGETHLSAKAPERTRPGPAGWIPSGLDEAVAGADDLTGAPA